MFKKKHLLTFVLLASILFLVFSSQIASAEDMTGPSWSTFGSIDPTEMSGGGEVGFKTGNPWEWLEGMVGNAMSYLFLIGMILMPLMILFGAYMFFTAAGDPSKAQNARRLIIGAIVGLAVLLSGKIMMSIFKYIFDF